MKEYHLGRPKIGRAFSKKGRSNMKCAFAFHKKCLNTSYVLQISQMKKTIFA